MTVEEIARALDEARGLRGAPRMERLERLAEHARACPDRGLEAEVLVALTRAHEYSAERARLPVVIGRLLRLVDENPVELAPYLRTVLWDLKWMTSAMIANPDVPVATVERWMGEMERRYRERGHSARPVHGLRASLAFETGDVAAGAAHAEAAVAAVRDGLADCHACESHDFGAWRVHAGDDEGALAYWAPVLDGEQTCAEEPHAVLADALLPLLRVGRIEDARSAHLKGYPMVRRSESLRRPVGLHLEFCALTGNEGRGLEILAEHAGWLTARGEDAVARLGFLSGALVLLRRLAALGLADLPLADGTVASVLAEAEPEARALAARYDARNGSTYRSDQLTTRLNRTPLLDRLPLGTRTARTPAVGRPRVPDASLDGSDAPVAEGSGGPQGPHESSALVAEDSGGPQASGALVAEGSEGPRASDESSALVAEGSGGPQASGALVAEGSEGPRTSDESSALVAAGERGAVGESGAFAAGRSEVLGGAGGLVAEARRLTELRHPGADAAWARVAGVADLAPEVALEVRVRRAAADQEADPAQVAAELDGLLPELGELPELRVEALAVLAVTLLRGGERERGVAVAEEAAEESEALWRAGRVSAVRYLAGRRAVPFAALSAVNPADPATVTAALAAAEAEIALAEEHGVTMRAAQYQEMSARVLAATGDVAGALPYVEAAYAGYLKAGQPWFLIAPAHFLAESALEADDPAAAEERVAEALRLARTVLEPQEVAQTASLLVECLARQEGRAADVVAAALDAADLWEGVHEPDHVHNVCQAARAYLGQDRVGEAVGLFEQVADRFEAAYEGVPLALTRRGYGQALSHCRDFRRAAAQFLAAASVAEELGEARLHADLAWHAADELDNAGMTPESLAAYQRAAALWKELGEFGSYVRCTRAVAWAELALDEGPEPRAPGATGPATLAAVLAEVEQLAAREPSDELTELLDGTREQLGSMLMTSAGEAG
ncbi:hypothetical protein [Actinocorallia sp. A-T 12471]|uniref:hypothetical protein n=1 Tax=Actinocorallia sp. A-T 12471 TaxID=3089813 RepID=UPI0029CC9E04|nr:hypothetical protein [Actinocorallia sp. A-T 12471]MDX6742945.1 hypothetical protein [Actinocorallia sp. A-T 12471]